MRKNKIHNLRQNIKYTGKIYRDIIYVQIGFRHLEKKKEILPHYGNEHAANAGNVKVPRHVDIADVISKDTQGQKEIQTRTDEHSGTAANNFENTHD